LIGSSSDGSVVVAHTQIQYAHVIRVFDSNGFDHTLNSVPHASLLRLAVYSIYHFILHDLTSQPASLLRLAMSDAREDQIALELLCCVMVAGGRATSVEKHLILDILKAGWFASWYLLGDSTIVKVEPGSPDACSWTKREISSRIQQFIKRVKADGLVSTIDAVCEAAQSLDLPRLQGLVQSATQLAKSDSKYSAGKQRVIERIRQNIPMLQFAEIAEIADQHPVNSRHEAFLAAEKSRQEEWRKIGKIIGNNIIPN
jgi:hypothetical protein